ncbi:DNA (cytosine-5)-methyltransferase 1 [Paenibacillus sp. PvP094]|uniref:DNA cytosine methyltransferase n=1 Tax=Paenibacillus sp. PvP094 TaxID=3156394 RepID=UPI0033973481
MKHSKNYNVLDLFCGAGGMGEGFLQAGFKIPVASDYSQEASTTYINRHKQLGLTLNFFQGDITQLTKGKKLSKLLGPTKIDVVVGGPPCQGFSLTGKRKADDPRNTLFLEFLKAVKLTKPKYFVMENVLGILSYKFEKITGISGTQYTDILAPDVICKEASLFGYQVSWKLLNAKDYGVPQNRLRVIFIGHKVKYRLGIPIDLVVPPKFPEPFNYDVTVAEAISDLNFLKNGESSDIYQKTASLSSYQKMLRDGQTPDVKGKPIRLNSLHNHTASKHNQKTIKRFKALKNGEKIGQLLKRLVSELSANEFKEFATKKRSCYKLIENGVSPTVLTLPDDIIHYDSNIPRILTVRELARIQSFDDSFVFLGKRTTGGVRRKTETPQYTQVGNAVPPLFSKAIALEIMSALLLSENDRKTNSVECELWRKENHLDLELIQS